MEELGKIIKMCIEISNNTNSKAFFNYCGVTNEIVVNIYPDGFDWDKEYNKCLYYPFSKETKYNATCLDYLTKQGVKFFVNDVIKWLNEISNEAKRKLNE